MITPGDIYLAYPNMNLNIDRTQQKVTSSVHCETSLALSFVQSYQASTTPVDLEIGTSKLSCWLCREFQIILRRVYPHIRIHSSSCHGKVTAGWTLPPGVTPPIAESMIKRVEDALDEIIERSVGKKRCDSISHALAAKFYSHGFEDIHDDEAISLTDLDMIH